MVLVAVLLVVADRRLALPFLCCFCVLLFISFAPSVNNVLPSLQLLRGGAGGGGLMSGLDGGRLFLLLCVFFSSAMFSSASASSFCSSRCCCRMGRQWQLAVMMMAVRRWVFSAVAGGVLPLFSLFVPRCRLLPFLLWCCNVCEE